MQYKAKVKLGWIICGKCGHKLARIIAAQGKTVIEFKCHSCKAINLYTEDGAK